MNDETLSSRIMTRRKKKGEKRQHIFIYTSHSSSRIMTRNRKKKNKKEKRQCLIIHPCPILTRGKKEKKKRE